MWTPYILIKILYVLSPLDFIPKDIIKCSNKNVTKILAIKFGLSVPEIFLPEIFLSEIFLS